MSLSCNLNIFAVFLEAFSVTITIASFFCVQLRSDVNFAVLDESELDCKAACVATIISALNPFVTIAPVRE